MLPPATRHLRRNQAGKTLIGLFRFAQTPLAGLAASGGARWKVENEAFNTLRTKRYHMEQFRARPAEPFYRAGHLLAFACHTVCELAAQAWRAAMRAAGTRQRFFQHLRAITTYLVFPSCDHCSDPWRSPDLRHSGRDRPNPPGQQNLSFVTPLRQMRGAGAAP
jgi:hypothetical protein